jgi:hypothetical protein
MFPTAFSSTSRRSVGNTSISRAIISGPLLILLSHKIRHRVFVYLSGRKMWYLDLSFSGSGDRNGRRVE